MTKYVVYGLGISGVSTAKFLANAGEEVIATDDNADFIEKKSQDPSLKNIKFSKPEEIDFDSNSIISFAPGIPLYFPKSHKILDIVKKTGATLTCDIELFYKFNPKSNFIGITGTNGKSTTTALTGFIFKELEIDSKIGGNIGIPCFDLPQNKENYIFETSSYQLDLLSQTHFKIAALLNITPDHIDRHGSFENYIKSKKCIFQNLDENDFAIIGIDNESSKRVFDELKNDNNFKSKLIPISTKEVLENGLSLIDGKLTNKINDEIFEAELKSDFLQGQHNEENIAFAFAITYCHLLNQDVNSNKQLEVIKTIKKFRGLPHRMQIIGEFNGIKFINDSKATNAISSENALKTYDNIFWILGGIAKEGGITSLQPYFNKVTKAYLIGKSSDEFAKILDKNSIKYEMCGDLKTAFKKAFFDAKNSGLSQKNILLSPACSSFDQWKNFEERGDYFHKLFNELSKSDPK